MIVYFSNREKKEIRFRSSPLDQIKSSAPAILDVTDCCRWFSACLPRKPTTILQSWRFSNLESTNNLSSSFSAKNGITAVTLAQVGFICSFHITMELTLFTLYSLVAPLVLLSPEGFVYWYWLVPSDYNDPSMMTTTEPNPPYIVC